MIEIGISENNYPSINEALFEFSRYQRLLDQVDAGEIELTIQQEVDILKRMHFLNQVHPKFKD